MIHVGALVRRPHPPTRWVPSRHRLQASKLVSTPSSCYRFAPRRYVECLYFVTTSVKSRDTPDVIHTSHPTVFTNFTVIHFMF